MSESALIELKSVGVRFGPTVVHRNINLKIKQGETVTILGPSGTGKTILLKLIIGLLMPSDGEVWVRGNDLTKLSESKLREVRRHVGMLFQGAALFDSLSIYENIAYGLRELDQKSEAEIATCVAEKLEMVGLPGIEHKFPGQLSGGQRKRIGLARALATNPQIMLFDEPTTGLDPTAKRLIDEVIIRMNQAYGMTSIAVTHDIESAERISNRWILLHDGEVIADGSAAQLLKENREAIDFIHGNWRDE